VRKVEAPAHCNKHVRIGCVAISLLALLFNKA